MRIRTTPADSDRRGASLVEMAIVLPIFLMVVMGIVEFGRGMMVGQLVLNAARHGARLAVLDGSTNADIETAVRDSLAATVGAAAEDATIAISITPAPGNADPANDLSLAQPKDLVRIFVSIPYDKVGYVGGNYLKGTELSGQCVMRHE